MTTHRKEMENTLIQYYKSCNAEYYPDMGAVSDMDLAHILSMGLPCAFCPMCGQCVDIRYNSCYETIRKYMKEGEEI